MSKDKEHKTNGTGGQKYPNGWGFTDVQMEELLRRGPPLLRPAPTQVLSVPISGRAAAAVKANPSEVRVVARATDGTTLIERPLRNPHNVIVRVDAVWEVDEHGRPVWPERRVVSDYNPIDQL
jgi:hypothetical protein